MARWINDPGELFEIDTINGYSRLSDLLSDLREPSAGSDHRSGFKSSPQRTLDIPPLPERKPNQMAAQPKDEPTREDILNSILRKIEKVTETAKAPVQAEPPQISAVQPYQLKSSIMDQIKRCWRLDAGARRAGDLIVEVTVNIAADGRVIGQPRVVDAQRMARDAYFRSAAENAVRAILQCSPFELPVAQYAEWKQMSLTFNAREMFGG